MKIKSLNQVVAGPNATIEMDSGDRVSIGFKGLDGQFQVVTLAVQGSVMVVTHEQSQDSLVVRTRGAQYVKG
jgi:hypothetical protein